MAEASHLKPMTADRLEKIMSGLPVDCRVRVFVPGIGDLEITGVSTMGQIATVRPKVADTPIRSRRAMAEPTPEQIDMLAIRLAHMGVKIPPRDTAFFQAVIRQWLEDISEARPADETTSGTGESK